MFRASHNRRRSERAGASHGHLESLEGRTYFSINAFFVGTQLNVFGDPTANRIVISRSASGTILVNGGAVAVRGARPTVAATRQVHVFGLSGNDDIELDETNGPLPPAALQGGPDNDTIVGGSADDVLFGQAGNDQLFGRGGADLLFGGIGDDGVTGGAGDDFALGQAGDDFLAWAPGDGSDRLDGGDGTDTASVVGADASETFSAAPDGARVRFQRTAPTPFALDIGTTEKLSLRANAGDDTFTAGPGLGALLHLTIDGGIGNDTILGSDGPDELAGRDGNDFIDGNGGDDLVLGGTGDDAFRWDPGDGNDAIDGQDGADALAFNGSDLPERFEFSPNGTRVRLTRDVGGVVTDLAGLEKVNLNALGGADTITVNDLAGTDLAEAHLDLGNGALAGDGSADSVVVNGTNGNDNIDVRLNPLSVGGLHTLVSTSGLEGATDGLFLNGLAGDDTLVASSLLAGGARLTEDGGAGDDVLVGSRGNDTILGGDGNDVVLGFRGADTAFLGAGDDTFEWDPGDGSDVVEGQAGHDTLDFIGSNDAERFALTAAGNRAVLSRSVTGAAPVTMDLGGIDQVDLSARGGADTVFVDDQSATDVTRFDLDLDGAEGTGFGDNAADSVFVNVTALDDALQVASFGTRVAIAGLFPFVNIAGEDGLDALTLNTLGGNDTVDAANLAATNASELIRLTENGGAGDDTLIGSQGADTFVWNPGDGSDTIDGGENPDTLVFTGSDVSEQFDLSAAAGNRVQLTRDLDAVTMDLGGVEAVTLNARGGADAVTVNDLTGTGVTRIDVDLSGTTSGAAAVGDGDADAVVVNGSGAGERIPVLGTGGAVLVNGGFADRSGLPYFLVMHTVEPTDSLRVNGNGGDDTIEADTLATPVRLTLDGGAGNDTLRGGPFNDTLLGGAGNDTLVGGPGTDLLDGGAGANVLQQD